MKRKNLLFVACVAFILVGLSQNLHSATDPFINEHVLEEPCHYQVLHSASG